MTETVSASPSERAASSPPQARRAPKVSTHHGVTLSDDYAWLRADNWQEVMRDPSLLESEIRDYLEAENAFMKDQLAATQDLQDTLFKEMKARLKEDDRQVPTPHGPFEYFPRFVKGGQYAQLCRIPRGEKSDEPQIILDGNRLQHCIARPTLQRTHRRRIAAKEFRGEGVDLIDRKSHAPV